MGASASGKTDMDPDKAKEFLDKSKGKYKKLPEKVKSGKHGYDEAEMDDTRGLEMDGCAMGKRAHGCDGLTHGSTRRRGGV